MRQTPASQPASTTPADTEQFRLALVQLEAAARLNECNDAKLADLQRYAPAEHSADTATIVEAFDDFDFATAHNSITQLLAILETA